MKFAPVNVSIQSSYLNPKTERQLEAPKRSSRSVDCVIRVATVGRSGFGEVEVRELECRLSSDSQLVSPPEDYGATH